MRSMPPRKTAATATRCMTPSHHRWRPTMKPSWSRRCRSRPCAKAPERAIQRMFRAEQDDRTMILRLLAIALCVVAILSPASAQTPDLAALAQASGTPEIPGLKIVWLAPWGDVAKAHPWRNIIVHQTEGAAESAPRAGP